MGILNKIVIYANPEDIKNPIYLEYDAGNGLQNVFNLDIKTSTAANNLFKLITTKKIKFKKNEIIYCYNIENKKIEPLHKITNYDKYIFAGSNEDGLRELIRNIRFCTDKKEALVKIYGNCNNHTYCLNESIINRKKGLKSNFIISDFENNLFFLEDYKKVIQNNKQ